LNMFMDFIWAFVIGGAICVVGQIMFDVLKLSPAHTMTSLVVIGAIVDGIGWYDPFIEFAGAGASVPITSFGNALVHGALAELKTQGWIGIITGIFEVTSAGVSSAIIFSFLAAVIFKPKG
jgi:stage V sporulation protein AE